MNRSRRNLFPLLLLLLFHHLLLLLLVGSLDFVWYETTRSRNNYRYDVRIVVILVTYRIILNITYCSTGTTQYNLYEQQRTVFSYKFVCTTAFSKKENPFCQNITYEKNRFFKTLVRTTVSSKKENPF